MNKRSLGAVILCVVIFGVLILSAFVDLDQKVTDHDVAVGNYAAYVQEGSDAVPEEEDTAISASEEELPEETADPAEQSGEVPEDGSESPTEEKESFLDKIASVNDFLNGRIAWGIFMCLLLVGTGVVISARTGFLQFRRFGYAMKNTLGAMFRGKSGDDSGTLSPFQALCTALAATVGTGNIAGVTGAIVMGGPGAVFWMWVAALFGMCTKYAEIVLAVKYREKNADGEWVGGPMYYIRNGLGKAWNWLGTLFAALGALAAFGIGSMTQVNTIAGTMLNAVDSVTNTVLTGTGTGLAIRWGIGIVIALLTGLVILGGLKRLGSVTEKIVPLMSVFYIIGALVVIIANAGNLGNVFGSIFRGAFTRQAAFGGVGGFVLMNAIKKGVGRGVFSNEAGLGSAPMAHATTSETDPVKQGLYGVFEVFADTIVICTMTALVVLSSNIVPWGNSEMAGADTTILAFGTVFGNKISSIFIAVAILFFAFSTLLSWSLYGVRCFGYLTKGKALNVYRCIYLVTVVLGAVGGLSLVWNIADTLNGFMAIPNLVAVLALSGVVVKETSRHFSKKDPASVPEEEVQ